MIWHRLIGERIYEVVHVNDCKARRLSVAGQRRCSSEVTWRWGAPV